MLGDVSTIWIHVDPYKIFPSTLICKLSWIARTVKVPDHRGIQCHSKSSLILKWSRILWFLPPTPCPQPAFYLWKNFSQRKSLIREVRKCWNKRNSQKRPNNNNVVTKQSQILLVPSQGLQIIFWTYSVSYLISTETPTRWGKLTMWWSDYSHDKAATILRISLKEMGKKNNPGLDYLKQSRWCWSDYQWQISR